MSSQQQRYGFRFYVQQYGYNHWYFEIGFPNRYGRWIPILISGSHFRKADECLEAAIKAKIKIEAVYRKRNLVARYKRWDKMGGQDVEDGA